MEKIDEFIKKLESNKTTPSERKSFIESLTKDEFIYFLTKDFTLDNHLAEMIQLVTGTSIKPEIDQDSIDARTNMFDEFLSSTKNQIKRLTKKEIKELLTKIKTQYVTIKNMLLEQLINDIHKTNNELDINSLIDFKHRIETRKITYEEIRSRLLKLTKEEFSFLICIGNQETDIFAHSFGIYEKEFSKVIENHAEVIAEFIECYTEEEIEELIPIVSESAGSIRKMFFKCLNEKKAEEIFLTNAPRYSNDIYNYVLGPTTSNKRDKLIINILSTPELYCLFSETELIYIKAYISNGEAILDEESNIINTYEKDITNEAAKFIANLRSRDNKSIKRGILKKLSARKLHDLLNEVNKGLQNINEDIITYEEFITLIEMPLDKTILFLKACHELSEEDKKKILNKLFKDNKYKTLSIEESSNRVIDKHLDAAISRLLYKDDEFDFVYRDLLDIEYKKEILDKMLEEYAKTMFAGVPNECINIFLSQIVEKEKQTLGLTLEKDFYVGRAYTDAKPNQNIKLGSFSTKNNSISINTNVFSELNKAGKLNKDTIIKHFLYRISMIETVFHEIRHAYQKEVIEGISNMRDFYFLLDYLLHQESMLGQFYYKKNYDRVSGEIDADLYAKISTAALLRSSKSLKELYWKMSQEEIHELSRKRKAPQIREKAFTFDEEKQKNIVDLFFEEMSSYKINELRDNYPMLDLIVDSEGYRLDAKDIQDMISEIEHIMTSEEITDEDYEQGESILNFLTEYMKKVYNKKAVRKKLI